MLAFRNGQHADDNKILTLDFRSDQLHTVVPPVDNPPIVYQVASVTRIRFQDQLGDAVAKFVGLLFGNLVDATDAIGEAVYGVIRYMDQHALLSNFGTTCSGSLTRPSHPNL